MDLQIEHDGQSWCFNVSMGIDNLYVKLRAYYSTPLPDREKPFSFDAPRVQSVPSDRRWWRGDGDRNIQRHEVPWPPDLDGVIHAALLAKALIG